MTAAETRHDHEGRAQQNSNYRRRNHPPGDVGTGVGQWLVRRLGVRTHLNVELTTDGLGDLAVGEEVTFVRLEGERVIGLGYLAGLQLGIFDPFRLGFGIDGVTVCTTGHGCHLDSGGGIGRPGRAGPFLAVRNLLGNWSRVAVDLLSELPGPGFLVEDPSLGP